jgi:hypothetical protein
MSTRVVFPRSRGIKGTHPLFFTTKGRGRAGIINLCLRPGRDAGTKEEFKALHRDNMRERKVQRYVRQINVRGPWYWAKRKNTVDSQKHGYPANREYFKSIWPKGKTVNEGRMLNGART